MIINIVKQNKEGTKKGMKCTNDIHLPVQYEIYDRH